MIPAMEKCKTSSCYGTSVALNLLVNLVPGLVVPIIQLVKIFEQE